MSSKKPPTHHGSPSSTENGSPPSPEDPTLVESPDSPVPNSSQVASTQWGSELERIERDPATTARLAEVLDDYLERLRKKEAPSRERLLAEHPDLAGELEACLAGLEFIQAVEAPLQSPAPQLGDFQIIREIGRGGMGAVYEAQQISLPRRVAIKVLRFGVVPDREAVERFRREAETVAGLHHTNIVPIFSVGQENGVNYYAMQFIDGPSLADVAATEETNLDPRRVAEWGLQAAEALAHAHQRGVVHRDVKPSNLLLDQEHRIWLTDFGLAKRHDDVTLSLVGVLLGTPRYMSPEQASAAQQPIDHRTDIYSLGATLYELLTGQPLFTGRSPHNVISQILTLEPRPPRQVRPSLPRDLETILLKCLAKKASARYHSAGDLADDLRAFLDERPIRARRANLVERSARWWKQQKRSVVLAGYTVMASVLLMALSLGGYQAWQVWQRSFVRLNANRGIVTAEWFREHGSPSHELPSPLLRQTLPVLDPTPFPAGRYQVRVSGDDRLSETWNIDLTRGTKRDVSADLDHQFLWSGHEVRHGYDFWHHDGRTDLLVYHREGIEIVDGAQGNLLRHISFLDESGQLIPSHPGLVWPASTLTPWGGSRVGERPHLATASPDLDGDSLGDIVLAGSDQAWVMAVSSESGRLIWVRGLSEDVEDPEARPSRYYPRSQVRSGIIEPPLPIGDLNQDGTEDFLINLFTLESTLDERTGKPNVQRRLEALSGKDGTTLWQLELPTEPFQLAAGEVIPERFRFVVGPNFSRGATGGFNIPTRWYVQRRPAAVDLDGDAIYVQGRLEPVHESEGLALLAGNRLLVVDPRKGEWRESPHELPWHSDLPLRWGHHAERDESFVLLVERIESDPALAGPSARIGAYSLAQRCMLWERTLDVYWPHQQAWHLAAPQWPLVAPRQGDGGTDVLLPIRSSASDSFSGTFQVPWGELACLDASTGEIRWERRLRTSDAQVDHFIVGPDLDGDGEGEVYVASLWGRRDDLYVEALSRVTGKTLWLSHQALSDVDDHPGDFHIHRLDWWQVSYRKSGPQLLVHLLPGGNLMDFEGHSRVQLIAAEDGTWTRHARNFQDSLMRDMDGDGVDELVLFRSYSLHQPDSGGKLSCLQGISSEPWRLLNSGLTFMDDVNHDGYGDLLQVDGDNRLTAFSGFDGRVLWSNQAQAEVSLRLQPAASSNAWGTGSTSYPSARPSEVSDGPKRRESGSGALPMTVVPGDLNGDGTPDLIGYPAFGHFFSKPHPILHAFSGRDGRQLWTAPIDVTNLVSVREGFHGIHGVDLDGDGLTEILFVSVLDYEYPAANFPSTDRTQLWCFVLSGRDGTIRWKQPLSQPYGLGASTPNAGSALRQGLLDVTELVQCDLDGDGVLDIIVPAERVTGPEGWELRALSGKDGRLLWRRPLAPCVEPGDAFLRYVPPVLTDWDDEEGLAGIVLEFTDHTLAGESRSTARLTCFSARDGQEIWTWETEVSQGTGQTLQFTRREIHEQRPRPVVLRGGADSKPCVAINLWGGAESAQLIVIDHAGEELGRTKVDQSGKAFRAWAVDIDRDGRDELVLLNREQVVALRFDNLSEPLWQRAIRPGMTRILDIAKDSLDERQLVVVAGNPFDGRLMALDASSGDVVWSCAGPRRGEQFNLVSWDDVRLLNPSDPSDTPQFAFVLDGMAVCRQGVRARLPSQIQIENLSLDSFTSSDQPIRDPRLARPLFSQTGDHSESQRANFRAIAWGAFFSLTLIIVPFRFVARSIRIGRWNLRWMLLVPAVVAMMLVVATLRVPDIRHMDVGSGVVVPKFIAGLLLLPPTLFVLYLIELSWRRRGKPILLWSLLVLGLAGLNGLVLIQARGSAEGMTWEPGEYYSWHGWHVFLLLGVYHAGVLVLLFRGARMLWMIARGFISSGRRPPQGSHASV